jgi:hypothetical protein
MRSQLLLSLAQRWRPGDENIILEIVSWFEQVRCFTQHKVSIRDPPEPRGKCHPIWRTLGRDDLDMQPSIPVQIRGLAENDVHAVPSSSHRYRVDTARSRLSVDADVHDPAPRLRPVRLTDCDYELALCMFLDTYPVLKISLLTGEDALYIIPNVGPGLEPVSVFPRAFSLNGPVSTFRDLGRRLSSV